MNLHARARVVRVHPHDYSEAELRQAHAELYAERKVFLPYHLTMANDCWWHFVSCRAHDIRNRRRALKPSGYVPAAGCDIRQTYSRARYAANQQLELLVEAA